MDTHRFRKGTGSERFRGCQVVVGRHNERCGLMRGDSIHGHSCTGKFLDNAAGGCTCYECGRSIPKGPPIFVGDLANARTRPWYVDRQMAGWGTDNVDSDH